VKSGKRRYPPLNRALYVTLRWLIRPVVQRLFRVHVEGLENIPAQGPFLLVSNHLSYLDSPLIFAVLPPVMTALAAEKYEHHLIFGPMLRVAGAIFIRRGEADRAAIQQVMAVLEDGRPLAMAIEGTRSRTGSLGAGKPGAAYFATRANVPLVLAAISGTERVRQDWLRLRRPEVRIRFAPPLWLPQRATGTRELQEYTESLMVMLAAMLPPAYRGRYARRPQRKKEPVRVG
jgi:1-acyl-sn-glycerol-3-phosphate acyltransferase